MNGLLNGWTNRNDTGRVKQLPPPNGTTEPTTEAATQSASHLSWNAKWPEARDATYIANPVPSQCESSYHGHRPDIRSTPPLWFKFHRGCCTCQQDEYTANQESLFPLGKASDCSTRGGRISPLPCCHT